MRKYGLKIVRQLSLPVLSVAILCFGVSNSFGGMGMGWGDLDSGGAGGEAPAACTPEATPVITPGPMGSPLKIFQADDRLYVADFTKYKIRELNKETLEEPVPLFDTRLQVGKQKLSEENLGRPLSIARVERFWGHMFFVGNDDRKTIDLYWQNKNNKIVLLRRLFKRAQVQALDMVVDRPTGKIYVVDGLHNEIKVLNLRGGLLRIIAKEGELDDPKGIAFDRANRELIVTDYGDPAIGIPASIKVFSQRGELLETITGAFARPQGVDVHDGSIYVVDAMLGQVLEFDRTAGTQTTTHGCFGTAEGHLLLPMDVVVDEVGQMLYVADNRNGRVTALPLSPQP